MLKTLTPAATERAIWPTATADVAAYVTDIEVTEELITSVRCIVRVRDRFVLCDTPDDHHVMPGGRRAPGESYEATARREVHEETGWIIDEQDLQLLGFLHFHHNEAPPGDHPYPHPDFLQLIYTAVSHQRDVEEEADWVDVEGWEQGSRLISAAELKDLDLSPVQRTFAELVLELRPE